MNNQNKVIFTVILLLSSIFFSCSDNSTDPVLDVTAKNYFPSNNGSNYQYNMEITDSAGATISAERTVSYNSTTTINSNSYQVLIDEFNFASNLVTDTSYFRKTNTQVFYYADMTQAHMLVPDSLKNLIHADNEAALLSFPLTANKIWPVYKFGLDFGAFVFNIISVNARVEASENLSLTVNNNSFNKEALKLKFTMTVAVDMNTVPITYTAEAWMVDEVGLVKLEGDSEAINFMIGNNMFLPGGYVKQTLSQYSIP